MYFDVAILHVDLQQFGVHVLLLMQARRQAVSRTPAEVVNVCHYNSRQDRYALVRVTATTWTAGTVRAAWHVTHPCIVGMSRKRLCKHNYVYGRRLVRRHFCTCSSTLAITCRQLVLELIAGHPCRPHLGLLPAKHRTWLDCMFHSTAGVRHHGSTMDH
jgi:hypothetical protein